MRLIIGSVVAALALTPSIITVGAADSRGIPTEGSVACNDLCKQWMDVGHPSAAGSPSGPGPSVDRRSTFVARYVRPAKPSDKRKPLTQIAHATRKAVAKSQATAALKVRTKPAAAVVLPARPAPSPAPPPLPRVETVAVASAPLASQPADVEANVSVQAIRFPEAVLPVPVEAVVPVPVVEPVEARAERAVRLLPPPPVAAPVSPTVAVAIRTDRPLLTVSGRLEAAFLLAALLAMVLSFQRLIGPAGLGPDGAKWRSRRPAIRSLSPAAAWARS